ncbi:MAG: hypothetical protein F6J93_02380 [Oscillatoria sp. SIO1A7]|nr:hypothetical protein [Oscillatoria sp. SIO1A7]
MGIGGQTDLGTRRLGDEQTWSISISASSRLTPIGAATQTLALFGQQECKSEMLPGDLGANRLGDKQTWGQTDLGTNRLGDKQTWGQTDLGTNRLGDKQTFPDKG